MGPAPDNDLLAGVTVDESVGSGVLHIHPLEALFSLTWSCCTLTTTASTSTKSSNTFPSLFLFPITKKGR